MDSVRGRCLVATALLLYFLCMQAYAETMSCVYTFYIRTGSRIGAGTDAVIGASLFDGSGYGVRIRDVVAWGGLMGKDYDYFERGNLDIFSGLGPCISSGNFCSLNLTSDGSGSQAGWYVKYVDVSMIGPERGCRNHTFQIEQWLASDSGYQLYAYRNNCVYSSAHLDTAIATNAAPAASSSSCKQSSRFLKFI